MCRNAYHHFKNSNYSTYADYRQKKMEAWKRHRFGATYPPVNIAERDDAYEIALLVPGFEKGDFNIHLANRLLTVSATKEKKDQVNETWRRQDFTSQSFERVFELNDKIDTTEIKASYEDGILKIILSKLEDAKTIRQEIDVI